MNYTKDIKAGHLLSGVHRYSANNSPADIIYNCDCLELLKLMPDRSIDLILQDMPYGTTQNKWDTAPDLINMWNEWRRTIKANGAIVLFSQGLFTAQLILSNPKQFKYKIVWQKSKATNFLNAKKQPLRKHEDICVFYDKQPTYNPQMTSGEPYNKGVRKDQLTGSYGSFKPVEVKSGGERYPTDVIYFKTAESEGQVLHPTQKPIELIRYLIRTYSNEDDLIFDGYLGSGTTAIGCLLENRRIIGSEVCPVHYNSIIDRINNIKSA